MKMILRTAFAALALATTTMAFADDHHGRDDHDRDRHGHDDRHDDRGRHHDNDWHGRPPPPHYYGNRGGYDHGGYYGGGYDHRPPPPRYYGHWERGHRYYGRNVVVYDYGSYRLRQPPRGYHWVRENNDFLLVALATGVILDIATR
jgi:Ni/Co efflux regulator RcnB